MHCSPLFDILSAKILAKSSLFFALFGESGMYKTDKGHQISFFDFNQSCGMQLDPNNEWIILAERIPWDSCEELYAGMFPSNTGRPALPVRIALGSLIIKQRKHLSDRSVVKEIKENPYLQYFIGFTKFQKEEPFTAPVLVEFRKRIDADFLAIVNDIILAQSTPTKEHDKDNENDRARQVYEMPDEYGNVGTEILDATVSPSNIRYPQDFSLTNEARGKLEVMIDGIHKAHHPWKKPRTYRRIARKEYLALAKSKKKSAKAIRAYLRRDLGRILRDMGYIEQYLSAGYELSESDMAMYKTIQELYRQQKYMFDNKTHTVENRIVSLNQPYIRPIVRGKAKTPVEFGAKYDVSIDEKGHARLEKINFEPYNESTIFIDTIERYRKRTGHYPKRVLVDKIYRTRENLRFCKEHHIEISGPKLGRPVGNGAGISPNAKQDEKDRIEIERFFSLDKRCNGAGLIMTKLSDTTLNTIALTILVTNLFATETNTFFVLYFMDCGNYPTQQQFIEIDPAA